jgi:septation ring formation regulator EzrA
MSDRDINVDEVEKAIENIEESISRLESLTKSSVVHMNFRKSINDLRSEKRRLEEEIEGVSQSSGVNGSEIVSEDVISNALREFSDKRGMSIEEGKKEVLSGNVDELLSLYKVYHKNEDNLPSDSELKRNLEEYVEDSL